jgi:hypothetical protein
MKNKKQEYLDDEAEEREVIEAFKKGKKVDIEIDLGLTTVLSVRMLKRTHEEMTKAAKELDMVPAKFAREAIEEKIASTDSSSAALLAQVLARLVHKIEELEKKMGAA